MERSVSGPSIHVLMKSSMNIVRLSVTMKLSSTITVMRLMIKTWVPSIANKKLRNVKIKFAGKNACVNLKKYL